MQLSFLSLISETLLLLIRQKKKLSDVVRYFSRLELKQCRAREEKLKQVITNQTVTVDIQSLFSSQNVSRLLTLILKKKKKDDWAYYFNNKIWLHTLSFHISASFPQHATVQEKSFLFRHTDPPLWPPQQKPHKGCRTDKPLQVSWNHFIGFSLSQLNLHLKVQQTASVLSVLMRKAL